MNEAQLTMKNEQWGFTLIELLVAIAIIGVLAALLMANFTGLRGRASDVTRKSDLQQVKKALRLYYNDFQHYPGAGSQRKIHGCGNNGWDQCTSSFQAGSNRVYMKQLPEDYSYYSDQADRFALKIELENVSDEDIETSQTACATSISALSMPVDETAYVVCED